MSVPPVVPPQSPDALASDADYRASHARKGRDYDTTLAESPFDAYMARWEAHWLATMVRQLHPDGVPRYLDFACGTGRILSVVAPLAREAIGVDVSASMLDVARAKVPVARLVHADITREGVDLGTFDVATAFRFFGNAQDELRKAVLRALALRIRDGGHLIINSHRNPRSLAAMLDHATGGHQGMDLHYAKLRRMLAAHGFVVVGARPIGAWLWRSRLLATVRDDARAARLERRFGAAALVAVAPDAVIVARRDGRPAG